MFQMPRRNLVPPKKSKRQSWDRENMANAIKAIKENKMGLKKAVKTFSVPRSTLQRLSRQDKPIEDIINLKLGRPTVLPKHLEEELVKYLLIMEAKFHGLTRNDVRRMAYQLCARNNIPHPESVLEHVVGVLKPNDEDAVCIFCEGQYSDDSRGERWVQCLACEMWAHDECAGCEKDAYICDFCH